jgi:hypothetical protein
MPSLSDLNNQNVGVNLDIDPALITWTGTTAPSNPLELKMHYVKIGNLCFVSFRLKYNTGGSACTICDVELPNFLPVPVDLTGTADGQLLTTGSGGFSNASYETLTSGFRGEMLKKVGGYFFRVRSASTIPFGAIGNFTYICE